MWRKRVEVECNRRRNFKHLRGTWWSMVPIDNSIRRAYDFSRVSFWRLTDPRSGLLILSAPFDLDEVRHHAEESLVSVQADHHRRNPRNLASWVERAA